MVSMRSEMGRMNLDQTFEAKDNLNNNIKLYINEISKDWGLECMRHEIKNIQPPSTIQRAMEL
jgi:regulator of protease activity HflC (stomatin/prohibitin superfamily)